MDKFYADTVRLLLNVAPGVFASDIFAMKGGTAINLFIRDMPRLSVDIDVVYTPWQPTRQQALAAITQELDAIAERIDRAGLTIRKVPAQGLGDTKLLIQDQDSLVKVEVNTVFRGTVLPVQRRGLSPSTADMFSIELTLPMLDAEELYGSKLVAALDRQHPRDLFDAWIMLESEGLTEGTVECFVTYLAGHNRPIHEVLFGKEKNIAGEYEDHFVGMTTEPVSLDVLLATREQLQKQLPRQLTDRHRQFLIGLARAEPDWSLLRCEHASELPALRWKLENLKNFRERRPADFDEQATTLESLLAG